MAVGIGGSAFALDTRNLDLSALWNGTVTEQSSTSLTVNEGGGFTAHFVGHDVLYNAFGEAAAGTITGISEDYLGQTTFSLTNLNVSASQFLHWVDTDDNFTAVHTILGGDDAFTGTPFDDYLEAFDGNDVVTGGSGADTILGDAGNDHLYGQSAQGGPDGADSLSGGDGADYLQGNAGNDTLDGGAGSDRINGGANDDLVTGGAGNDTVNGNLGNDTISGGDGNDSLRGGQGDDVIDGGFGDDVIMGDLGFNTMTGGAGHDIFKFGELNFGVLGNNADVITDYESGIDHLSLSRVVPAVHDYGIMLDPISALRFFAETQLSHGGQAYDVAVFHQNGDTVLLWETPGSTTFDRALILRGEHTITTSDFV